MKRTNNPCHVLGLTLLALISADAGKVSVVSLKPTELVEYETQPEAVKRLIEVALELTTKGLGYQFGSNSPEKWGMDCSGTVQCALGKLGLGEIPRSSWHIYQWAEAAGGFQSTPGATTTKDSAFADLRPGDLLFWEGTYETKDRDPAISHVMIYLGTLKEDGKGVMFGASSGRRYRGQSIHGVSVFDWEMPKAGSTSKFVGYARVPGLKGEAPAKP